MHKLLAPTAANLAEIEAKIVAADKVWEAAVLAGDNARQNALRVEMAEFEMQASYLRRVVR